MEGCCLGSFRRDCYQSHRCRWATADGTAGSSYEFTFISNSHWNLIVFRTGALPSCPSISCEANTGAGHDFTGLIAAVQLRLRVASGLQTLTVKSRLLTGENSVRIRGDPPFPQGREPAQGRPPPARGRPQAAQRPARAEGTAGHGPHSQRPRRGRVEAVPQRVNQRESGRQSSLSQGKPSKTIPVTK